MKDVFSFAAPLPVLGRLVEIMVLRRYMLQFLHERNEVVSRDRRIGRSGGGIYENRDPAAAADVRAFFARHFHAQGHTVTVCSAAVRGRLPGG